MDAALKELAKLEKLANAKAPSISISSTLENMLQTLYQSKEAMKTGDLGPEQFI